MLRLVFIFTLVSTVARGQSSDIYGEYQSFRPTPIQWAQHWLSGVTGVTTSCALTLNRDSTCYYKNCGTQYTGRWETRKDSLLLYLETAEWVIDSLQTHGFNGTWPIVPSKPYEFKIKGKTLRMSYRDRGSPELLTELRKVE